MKIDGNNDGFEGSPMKICENCLYVQGDDVLRCGKLTAMPHGKPKDDRMAHPLYPCSLIIGPKFGCVQWEDKK